MNSQNYSYPLDPSWTTKEMETVIAMFRAVEDAVKAKMAGSDGYTQGSSEGRKEIKVKRVIEVNKARRV